MSVIQAALEEAAAGNFSFFILAVGIIQAIAMARNGRKRRGCGGCCRGCPHRGEADRP